MDQGQAERQRDEYLARINRVLDYIDKNLDRPLTLDELAGVANFSRFHFHRVFRAMVGETLNRFVQRVRIERAAMYLIYNPKKSVTDIALDCGFSGSAAFSRTFKEYFGRSPSQWRTAGDPPRSNGDQPNSNIRKAIGNQGKDYESISFYLDPRTNQPKWRIIMEENREVQVEVKELPDLHVAYVRHIGPYAGDGALFQDLFTRLMTWAGPRNLLQFPDTQMLSVYHDDPEITEEEKLRVSACITVPGDTKVDGEIGRMVVPGGQFAVARFTIGEDEYAAAWNAVVGGWLPQSGYQPDDRLCFELYHNNPDEHPEKKHIVDICFPVRPL